MLKKKVCPSSKLLTLIPFKTCDVVSKIMTALFGKSQSHLVTDILFNRHKLSR